LLHQAPILVLMTRTEHDHAVAESQLGVCDQPGPPASGLAFVIHLLEFNPVIMRRKIVLIFE
jgi:hypothetical protein